MDIPENMYLELEWMCWTIDGVLDQCIADRKGIGFNGKIRIVCN